MIIINIYQGWADHGGGVQWATANNAQQVLTTGLLEMIRSISFEPFRPFHPSLLNVFFQWGSSSPKTNPGEGCIENLKILPWKKSIFTHLYIKVDLSATFTPIQNSNLPTQGDRQIRSDQIYQYILPARCSFFRDHLLQFLYLSYCTCRSLKVEANTNGWTHNQYLPEGWLCHKTQDNNIRSVSFHW